MTAARPYFRELDRLLAATACTDATGSALDLDEAFRRAVELLGERLGTGKAVLLVGNGGSAAIASHMTVDFFKAGYRAASFNDGPMLTCMGNDYGYENVFAEPVKRFAGQGDVLVAISSSGRSPSILNACAAARSKGGSVLTMSGFQPDNPLRSLGDVNFYVPSSSYGFVEVAHSAFGHALFDGFMGLRATGA